MVVLTILGGIFLFSPVGQQFMGRSFASWRPLSRVSRGFHRLGLLVGVPPLALGLIVAGNAILNPQPYGDPWFFAGLLSIGGVLAYLVARGIGWVVDGFTGAPESMAVRPEFRLAPASLRFADSRIQERSEAAGVPQSVTENPEPNSTAVEERPVLKGIGGWLILPALGTLISPFRAAWESRETFSLFSQMSQMSQVGQAYFSTAIIVNCSIILGWAYTAFLMVKYKRRYPAAFMLLSLVSLVVPAMDAVFVTYFLNVTLQPEDLKGVIQSLVSCMIWVPYMRVSVRVKNTFVRS